MMAKVTMYRGIDFDGDDSWIAVSEGRCVRTTVGTYGGDKMSSPETFGVMDDWLGDDVDDEDRDVISRCVVVWEADL